MIIQVILLNSYHILKIRSDIHSFSGSKAEKYLNLVLMHIHFDLNFSANNFWMLLMLMGENKGKHALHYFVGE